MRCGARATRSQDALAWGAQLLIVKGDLTHHGTPEEWATVGELLAGLHVRVAVVPGNHDVKKSRLVEPQPALASHGLHLVHGVEVIDMPGIRVVLADTTVPDEHRGRVAHLAHDIVRVGIPRRGRRARRAAPPSPALSVPDLRPARHPGARIEPSAPRPRVSASRDARHHRPFPPPPASRPVRHHRHRGRLDQGLPRHVDRATRCTKEASGKWYGRISDPSCLPWLDHTARAGGGFWGVWSPGDSRRPLLLPHLVSTANRRCDCGAIAPPRPGGRPDTAH